MRNLHHVAAILILEVEVELQPIAEIAESVHVEKLVEVVLEARVHAMALIVPSCRVHHDNTRGSTGLAASDGSCVCGRSIGPGGVGSDQAETCDEDGARKSGAEVVRAKLRSLVFRRNNGGARRAAPCAYSEVVVGGVSGWTVLMQCAARLLRAVAGG